MPTSTNLSRSIPSMRTTCRCCVPAASCKMRKPCWGWRGPAYPSGRSRAPDDLFLFFFAAPRLLIGGNHRLCCVCRHLFIVRELHRVPSSSLGDRPQVDREPVHRREGDLRPHLFRVIAGWLHARNLAALPIEVADHVAHVAF